MKCWGRTPSDAVSSDLKHWLGHELFDVAPIAIATIDREFNIVLANPVFERIFGPWRHRKCYDVYKDRASICPQCHAAQSFDDGQSRVTPEVGVDENGRITRYMKHTVPIVRESGEIPYLVEMSVDVTESFELENELRIAHNFLDTLITASLDGMIGVDDTQEVRLVNHAARTLFKLAPEDVLRGDALRQILPAGFFDEVFATSAHHLLQDAVITAIDGEQIPVRLVGVKLESDGRLLGGAASLTDLRLIKALEHDKLEAERLAAVGQTVAGLAHGVKNLLTGLEGGMYLISTGLKKNNRERVDNGWDMLSRNIARISTFVKDFLSFSKGRTITVEPCDPRSVAREVVALYAARAEEAGVGLTWEAVGDVSEANLDYEGLHECLTNLVGNAIDACQMSDQEEACHVHVRVIDQGNVLVYEVEDDGVGMDYELKQKVFTTFFTTKGLGGTGLGLLTTRKIIQEHGGSIALESTPGEGSMFTIRLPRDRLPATTPQSDG